MFLFTTCLMSVLSQLAPHLPIHLPFTAPQRILFIGNSFTYTNDLPHLVQELFVFASQPKPVVEALTHGGASLGDHWLNRQTETKITKGSWDYIILQQGPSSLASSQKEFQRDMATAKPWFKQSHSKVALFMVWPDTTRQRYFPQVRQAYADAAKSVDGLFLPAGVAWQHALGRQLNLSLYSGDGLHPTPAGTYLAAMVIVARLTNTKPDLFPQHVTWSRQYQVRLTRDQHQSMVQAATEALKDKGN